MLLETLVISNVWDFLPMWSSILTGPKLKNTGKSSITTTQTLFLSADMSEMLLTL